MNTAFGPPLPPEKPVAARFQGTRGRVALAQALEEQLLVRGDPGISRALTKTGRLRQLAIEEELCRQGDGGNEIYFILTGALQIVVDGRPLTVLRRGHHVGELALVDPVAPRGATLRAVEPTVVLELSAEAFLDLADRHPKLWRRLAIELAWRLKQASGLPPMPTPTTPAPAEPLAGISPRQEEILRLLVAGFSNKEIAARLNIAIGTVKIHVSHLLAKLGVADRTRAAIKGRALGY